jgi:putative ABC transport system permease protein
MTMLQGFQIALHALRLNPLRSILTMLGIVIGVASIVTVFAIGSGAQLRLQEQIRSIGANVLMINPGAVYQGGVRLKDGSKLTMTESDVQAILEQIPEIQAAAGSIAGTAQVIHESKNWNTTINGTTTGHFMVRDWQLATGRYFSGTEEAGAGKVVILGSTVAQELFAPGEDPIGDILNPPAAPEGPAAETPPAGTPAPEQLPY